MRPDAYPRPTTRQVPGYSMTIERFFRTGTTSPALRFYLPSVSVMPLLDYAYDGAGPDAYPTASEHAQPEIGRAVQSALCQGEPRPCSQIWNCRYRPVMSGAHRVQAMAHDPHALRSACPLVRAMAARHSGRLDLRTIWRGQCCSLHQSPFR